MVFNSIEFALFFLLVFILYWFIAGKNIKWQNMLLLGASLFFYGCWDWRFLLLLSFSTFLGYFTGIRIGAAKSMSWKKFWFRLSIIMNIGFLAVFKYYNFFVDSFTGLFNSFGMHLDSSSITLNVILPVGISFYTFHVLSYVIDIYYDRIKSEGKLVDFSVFVAFFPLLVAGPIERATHLLPQIQKKREFNYSKSIV